MRRGCNFPSRRFPFVPDFSRLCRSLLLVYIIPHHLDEATNQLDDAAACRLMQTLKTALPDTLCLAISHQAAIKALFTRQIDLNRYRAPAGLE